MSTKSTMSTSANAAAPVKTPAVALEAGDEFEDFPVDNWDKNIQQQPANLWEEQWEDDDHFDDDFAGVLKAEIQKNAPASS